MARSQSLRKAPTISLQPLIYAMPAADQDKDLLALASPLGKRVIAVLAVVQALLLLAFHEMVLLEWGPFQNIIFRTVYLTIVIAVPAALYLLLDDPRKPRPWWYALGLALALLPLAFYAGSLCAPASGVRSEPILVPFGLTIGGAWFISMMFLQAARTGNLFAYDMLFEAAWHNALSLVMTALFAGVFWLLLALWGALFDVLGISFFEDVFYDRRFVYAATGLVGGLGLVIIRSYGRTSLVIRRLLHLLAKALLPLLALITLIFLAALPFSGLQPLWETGRAALLLMILLAMMLFFLNGVLQDEPGRLPYPAMLRMFVAAAYVALPVYAGLSAYALSLRVHQYGWTTDRFWAALLIGGLGAYALAYAAAALRRRASWFRSANIALSLVVLAVLVLVNTPLMNPISFVVADQVERLRRDVSSADENDLRYLRYETGERGYQALRRLQSEEGLTDRPRLSAHLDQLLSQTGRDLSRPELEGSSPDALRGVLEVAPSGRALPPGLLTALSESPRSRACIQPATSCIVLVADVHDRPEAEYVLFQQRKGSMVMPPEIYAAPVDTSQATWHLIGTFDAVQGEHAALLIEALQAGRYAVHPSPWRELRIGDVRLHARQPAQTMPSVR